MSTTLYQTGRPPAIPAGYTPLDLALDAGDLWLTAEDRRGEQHCVKLGPIEDALADVPAILSDRAAELAEEWREGRPAGAGSDVSLQVDRRVSVKFYDATPKQLEIWRNLTPRQRDYDRFVAGYIPRGVAMARETDLVGVNRSEECTCHIAPPCSFCPEQPDPDADDDHDGDDRDAMDHAAGRK